jgi:hypothetical protein
LARFVLCCGGLFATTSTARSKRAHASEWTSDCFGFVMSTVPEDEPYFAALGRFIASYALAEQQVHLLARHLTRLTDAKARIVFSGMRLGELSERIRGLLKVTKATAKRYNEIDHCLQQLDLIAPQRNNLVHRFVRYSEGKIIVTNTSSSLNI